MAELKTKSYYGDFSKKCPKWKSEPTTERNMTDIPGCLLLAGITIAFFAMGAAQILGLMKSEAQMQKSLIVNVNGTAFQIPLSVGSCVSAALAAIVLLILKFSAAALFNCFVGICAVLMVVTCVVAHNLGNIFIVVIISQVLLFTSLALYSQRAEIKNGFILLKAASKFLEERPSVMWAAVPQLLFGIGLLVFWSLIYTVINLRMKSSPETFTTKQALPWYGLLFVFNLFYTCFGYYFTTFVVGVECAGWFYKSPTISIMTSFKWAFFHMGSFTYATVIQPFLFVASLLGGGELPTDEQGCLSSIKSFFINIFSFFQPDLVRMLGHNGVLAISFTGEPLFDSARVALGLFEKNFNQKKLCDLMSSSALCWISMIGACLGTLISYFLSLKMDESLLTKSELIMVSFMCCLFPCCQIACVFSESVSAVFTYFSINERFAHLGIEKKSIVNDISDAIASNSERPMQDNQK